jgi:CRISPR-associated protein (TIGR02710 family)
MRLGHDRQAQGASRADERHPPHAPWYSPRHMAQDQPVAALVVALTEALAPAVYTINRLRPESLCFVLPEAVKMLVETDVQPRISPMPRRWDWVLLSDPEHFPSSYQTIARSLPAMLRTWEVDPGALVVDVTGATAAMAGALLLVATPFTSRIVSLADPKDGRDGETVDLEGVGRLWISNNPWDEAADSVRREGCELFNRGAFVGAATVFRQLERRVSGGQKPLYRAFVDLTEGYDLWERFHYRQAWEKLKAAVKALEMASLFGGPPGIMAALPAIKANAGFLEKLVLDPADVKELLASDLLAHADRRLRTAHDTEAAMRALIRALEAFAQLRLFRHHRIKSWDVQPDQLPEALREICRACYLEDIDGKFVLPMQAQFRLLAALNDPIGHAFGKEWPAMKPLLNAANQAVLGRGAETVKGERVKQLFDVVVKLSSTTDASLPKFPTLSL